MGAMKEYAITVMEKVQSFYENYLDYDDEPLLYNFQTDDEYFSYFWNATVDPDGPEHEDIMDSLLFAIERYENGESINHCPKDWNGIVLKQAKEIVDLLSR